MTIKIGVPPVTATEAQITQLRIDLGLPITTYTAAQLDAKALAGTLIPNASYRASDTGARYHADDAYTLVEELDAAELSAVKGAVAEGLATLTATEIRNIAGVPPSMGSLVTAAEAACFARTMTVKQLPASMPRTGQLVNALQAFASPFTITDAGSNRMRIQSTGNHGMGVACDGKSIWIKTSAGVPTGIYPIYTRATANQIEVDVGATLQPLIATTVVTETAVDNLYFPAVVFAIPGGLVGPNGSAHFQYLLEAQNSGSAGTRYHGVFAGCDANGVGGAVVGQDGSLTTANGYNAMSITPMLVNINSEAVQRSLGHSVAFTYTPPSHTIDTSATWYCAYKLKFGSAVTDYWMELLKARVMITPGV